MSFNVMNSFSITDLEFYEFMSVYIRRARVGASSQPDLKFEEASE